LFPDSFVTARLSAERLRAEHWDAIREMDTNPDYMALLGGVRSEEISRAYVERNLAHWDAHNFGLWILRDSAQRVAGRCVLRHLDVDGTDEIELGYGFLPHYWRKGLATEVARELLRLGQTELRAPTLVAITTARNLGSRRVLLKTGLAYERDVLHEGVPHMLFRSRA
jgi:RimJ/RimL family protein N-acetyltransferase